MNARTTCRLLLLTLLITASAAPLQAAAPPEAKELDRYIGEWKSTIENQDVTATSRTEWILQEQIVRQTITYSDGAETLIHRGYDKAGKQYFLTLFDSRGVHWWLTGNWDEATDTFRFEGRLGESTVQVKSTFRDNNQTEDWTITLISTDGNVTEIRGTNKKIVK